MGYAGFKEKDAANRSDSSRDKTVARDADLLRNAMVDLSK
jgi:hypothetical protein